MTQAERCQLKPRGKEQTKPLASSHRQSASAAAMASPITTGSAARVECARGPATSRVHLGIKLEDRQPACQHLDGSDAVDVGRRTGPQTLPSRFTQSSAVKTPNLCRRPEPREVVGTGEMNMYKDSPASWTCCSASRPARPLDEVSYRRRVESDPASSQLSGDPRIQAAIVRSLVPIVPTTSLVPARYCATTVRCTGINPSGRCNPSSASVSAKNRLSSS